MYKTPDHMIAARRLLADDPHRPLYHYLPPANWMNDPNGLFHWNGTYHLFYQHNPNEVNSRNMHWGHAISRDLVHWEDLPIALTPTPGGPDAGGCWSGCAVDHGSVPTLLYTGVLGERGEIRQAQCMAKSDDELLTWHKHDDNPIIVDVPPAMNQTHDFRDPFVWREDDVWYMVLGSRIENVGGAVLRYESRNLVDWKYLGPIFTGDIKRNGQMWECPNFFQLGDKWVMILSAHTGTRTGSVLYYIGDFENCRFRPKIEGVLDCGYLYAPLTLLDAQGRRLLWGWLREGRSAEGQAAAGWSGVQSIPCELVLLPDGHLGVEPIPELQSLRAEHLSLRDIHLLENQLLDIRGSSLEILLRCEPGDVGEFGLVLAASEDGRERTSITYNVHAEQLVVNREQSSHDSSVDSWSNMAPHSLAPDELLELHLFLDGSVLEIFANKRTRLTSRIYPTSADSQGLALLTRQNEGRLHSLDIWQMRSIWPS